ncbi:MAG TPA: ATP-binding protein [Myxococcota bacterium]|nr:ATP-binding protein [Myxococcota bacterium]HRY91920.1 ATP-binding protein [Myxococcota bacterium]HSA21104.1 ATP-binding protein [Myxococcota bacterium]
MSRAPEHPQDELGEALQRSPEALHQLAKLAELGQQVAVVVHELSQPLLGIKAFAQILQRKYQDDAFLGPKLEIIVRQAELMDEMLSGLRQYGRTAVGARPRAEPGAVVRSCVELLGERARKLRVQVLVDGDQGGPEAPAREVRCSPGKLQQIVVNLLTNALDELEPRHGGRILLRLSREEAGLRLLVADSGAGVPEEHRARLFEAFYTSKAPGRGTGLGLSICRDILQRCGGDIRLLSREEAAAVFGQELGASFEVRLPWAEPEGAAAAT